MGEPVRLQKFLSRAGVASRRDSEELIAAGRVRVDGEVVSRLGAKVDPEESAVEVDGEPVRRSPALWIALHKPPRVLTSRGDPEGRRTVYDLLPDGPVQELFHVGRLDYMSEGLLLLTNEGDLSNQLLRPGNRVPRRYEVGLVEPAGRELPRRLLRGVELEDGVARADAATVLPAPGSEGGVLLLTLHEGRNREIRRMMKRLGRRVRYLKRVSFGPVALEDTGPGEWRELSEDEVQALRREAGRQSSAVTESSTKEGEEE